VWEKTGVLQGVLPKLWRNPQHFSDSSETFTSGGQVFFCFFFGVFQPGFVAFVASVAAVAFVGVWLLWLYHAIPIYLSI
jgi:hypothetical protein